MAEDKSPPIGPIGQNVVRNVEELRKARGWSLRELSDRLTAVGRPILSTVLHRLSQGKRRVDADDLVALSLVLGVNPNALLFPRHGSRNDTVQLTDNVLQRAYAVWLWADGSLPLPPELAEAGATTIHTPGDRYFDFVKHARPGDMPDQDPAVDELDALKRMLQTILANPNDADRYAHWRDTIIRRFRLVAIQLEELLARFDRMALANSAFEFDQDGMVEQLRNAVASVRPPTVDWAPGTAEREQGRARSRYGNPREAEGAAPTFKTPEENR